MKKKQKSKRKLKVTKKRVRKTKELTTEDRLIDELLRIDQHDGFYEGGF